VTVTVTVTVGVTVSYYMLQWQRQAGVTWSLRPIIGQDLVKLRGMFWWREYPSTVRTYPLGEAQLHPCTRSGCSVQQ